MKYVYSYKTPDGFSDIMMISDGEYLTGLWFIGSNEDNDEDHEIKELEIFNQTCRWLNIYFSGKNPDFIPKYKIENLTSFRQEVIDIMNDINYGELSTYNDIAKIIAKKHNIKKMSAQAVGGAVGWNPICIIIPCHRVIGSNGNLTGYGGGISNKIKLLELEGIDTRDFKFPKEKK